MNKKATIISFEGPEGSGKTTVIEAVRKYFKKRRLNAAIFREPGSTAIGEEIRQVILNTSHQKMDVYTELLLYLACRTQLIREKIQPLLSKKGFIILDRFTDSTIVYQGLAGGLPAKWVMKAVKEFSLGITPDMTFLLDVDERLGLRRSRRKDRMEQKSLSFHRKVRQGYLKLARTFPGRIKVIEDKEINRVIKSVLNHLEQKCLR
jgi:dTMP kinase